MCDQLVGGGTELRMTGKRTVLGAVDVRLEVLYAHSHGEGLALEGDACVAKQLEHVSRRVSAGKYHVTHGPAFLHEKAASLSALEDDCRHMPAPDVEFRESGAQAQFPARGLDALADLGDDGGEQVASHMGLRIPEYAAWRPGLHEGLEDEAVRRALGAGLQLAIGETAGSAQTELYVALGVKLTRSNEALDVGRAPRSIPATLHEQGFESCLCKREGAE